MSNNILIFGENKLPIWITDFYHLVRREKELLSHSKNALNFLNNQHLLNLKTPCVYVIYCKVARTYYVGETTYKGLRISDHLKHLEKNKHENPRLQNDWNTYGSSAFQFVSILEDEKCSVLNFRLELERLILQVDPNYCYNKDAFPYTFNKPHLEPLEFSVFREKIQRIIYQLIHENVTIPVSILPSCTTPCVYIFWCKENNFYYIGETTDKLYRLTRHVVLLGENKHENSRFQQDWDTYGSKAFSVFIIAEGVVCHSRDCRLKLEKAGVRMNPTKCYNKEAVTCCRLLKQTEKIDSFLNEKYKRKGSGVMVTTYVDAQTSLLPENIQNYVGNGGLLQKIINNGVGCGFIFIGVLYYNSSQDSAIEYFCTEHKMFITRTWDRWQRCFAQKNEAFRPSCCSAAQQKKALTLNTSQDFSLHSSFSKLPANVTFSAKEQNELAALLCSSKKKYVPFNIRKELPSSKEDRKSFVYEQANRLDADVLDIEGWTAKSKVFLYCRKCKKENKGTELSRLANTEKLRCCRDQNKGKGISSITAKMECLGHEVVGDPPRTKKDKFRIRCKTHNVTLETNVDKYRLAKSGMRCCAYGNTLIKELKHKRVKTARAVN